MPTTPQKPRTRVPRYSDEAVWPQGTAAAAGTHLGEAGDGSDTQADQRIHRVRGRATVKDDDTLARWYSTNRPRYERLTRAGAWLLESLLREQGIDYLSVTSRTKEMASLLEKAGAKGYGHPETELTDISGIRVIAYIESDVARICGLVRSCFEVDESRSLDKAQALGTDKVGYRAVHFVCRLGEERTRLAEFSAYADMVFEIQVRTVLQHVWAEIEHDRSYKFSGVLPTELQRRLHLIAGQLEAADREFDALAKEIDAYSAEVGARTDAGDLGIELTTRSLQEYLQKHVRGRKHLEFMASPAGWGLDGLIGELKRFGLETLSDLDHLLDGDFVEAMKECQFRESDIGLLRDAMMYRDLDRYFEQAWAGVWDSTDTDTLDLLSLKYDAGRVKATLGRHAIGVFAAPVRFL